MQVAKIMAGYTLGEAEQFRRAMTHKRSYEAMERLCDDLVERMLTLGHDAGAGRGDPADGDRVCRLRLPARPCLPVRAPGADLGHPEAALPGRVLRRPPEQPADGVLRSAHAGLGRPPPRRAGAAGGRQRQRPGTACWKETGPGQPPPVRQGEGSHAAPAPAATVSALGKGLLACGSGSAWCAGSGSRAREVLERERARARTARSPTSCGGPGSTATPSSGWPRSARSCASTSAARRSGGPASWPGSAAQATCPGSPISLPRRADLPAMDAWESTRADYAGLGLSPDRHLVSFYRPRLRLHNVRTAAELEQTRAGPVRIGGIVICRQRPETANDFMFMTLEDETGLVNVIVQPKVYHAQTRVLRGEPLLVIEGILQREGDRDGRHRPRAPGRSRRWRAATPRWTPARSSRPPAPSPPTTSADPDLPEAGMLEAARVPRS